MKVVVLQCTKCDEPTIVNVGQTIPCLCHWCGGYLRYIQETEIGDPKEVRDGEAGTHEGTAPVGDRP